MEREVVMNHAIKYIKKAPSSLKKVALKKINIDQEIIQNIYIDVDLLEIKTEKINDNAIETLEFLELFIDRLKDGTEEHRLTKKMCEKLIKKISTFEDRYYADNEYTSPLEMLKYLLEVNNLKQKDLVNEIGSKGHVSDVLNGNRPISVEMAKRLGKKFAVKPLLFLDLE